MNDFHLAPAMSARNWLDGKYDRTLEHHFLDFMIEGCSLRDLVGEPDMVTPLSRPWLEGVPAEIERLLGRRETEELSAGRGPCCSAASMGTLPAVPSPPDFNVRKRTLPGPTGFGSPTKVPYPWSISPSLSFLTAPPTMSSSTARWPCSRPCRTTS